MTKAQRILSWYDELELKVQLPADIKVLNPYQDMTSSTRKVLEEYYERYYGDENNRRLILGINPGRLGAGLTGIPFTDTPALDSISLHNPDVSTTETSADFVWKLVAEYGGPEKFFGHWFIGAVSPLGFIQKNDKGNWVNYNYYDRPEIFEKLKPFIVEQLKLQIEIAGNASDVVLFGTGKNAKALNDLNSEYHLFNSITAVEHPRFVMQYRRKRLDEYLEKFVGVLGRLSVL